MIWNFVYTFLLFKYYYMLSVPYTEKGVSHQWDVTGRIVLSKKKKIVKKYWQKYVVADILNDTK